MSNDRVNRRIKKESDNSLAGIKFTILDQEAYASFIGSVGSIRKRVCVVNARALYFAQEDLTYFNLLNSADIVVSDGMPIYRILKWRGYRGLLRKRGIDIFYDFLSDPVLSEKRHLFLGTTSQTLEKLQKALKASQLCPHISMFEPLPFGNENGIIRDLDIEKIKEFNPDVIWVSLGAPKQDIVGEYIYSNLSKSTIIGVGLVFDYVAGNVRKPPEIVAKLGFEWLFRIFTQTKRTRHFVKPFFFILGHMLIEISKKLRVRWASLWTIQ